MPRRPDWSRYEPDARLDPYRERVGRLYRGGQEIGLLLVRVTVRARVESGHWWWRTWSPAYESLWTWLILDGRFSDHETGEELVAEDVQDLAAGHFKYLSETLEVEWTTRDESRQLRRTAFEMDDADLSPRRFDSNG